MSLGPLVTLLKDAVHESIIEQEIDPEGSGYYRSGVEHAWKRFEDALLASLEEKP